MAISSFPFDGQDTDENQFSLLFKELQDSGVADTHGGNGFKVAVSTGMAVTVQPGFALLRGFAVNSTATETRTIPTSGTGTILHRIILRLDPTTNTIGLDVLSGVSGGTAPVLTQTVSGIYEISLATITVATGTSVLTAGMVADDRPFLGTRVGAWTTALRPSAARKGHVGYNSSLGYWEGYTGSSWQPLAPQEPVGTILMSALPTPQAGWLKCDGTEYTTTAYPILAAAIGQTYGGTAGATFRTPNLSNAFPTQVTATRPLASVGGSATRALTEANLAPHAHSINHDHGTTVSSGSHTHAHKSSDGTGTANSVMAAGKSGAATTFEGGGGVQSSESPHTHPIPVFNGNSGVTGTGTAFDVTNPWLALNFLIKAV